MTLGQVAYEAYAHSINYAPPIRDVRLPEWDSLLPYFQAAWQAAGEAVRDKCDQPADLPAETRKEGP